MRLLLVRDKPNKGVIEMDFSEPNYDVLTVTPEMAREILGEHKNYRRLGIKRVQIYAEAMENNRWSIAQPLMFCSDGHLIDGQHRLEAVIRSGTPQNFTILTGIPKNSVSAIDGGQPRSGNQVLLSERPDSMAVAQVIRAVSHLPSTEGRATLNSELPFLWDKYQPHIYVGCEITSIKNKGICKAAFRAAVVRCLMAYPDSEQIVRTLVNETTTGIFRKSKNAGILMRLLLAPYGAGGSDKSKLYLRSTRILFAEIQNTQLSKIPAATIDFFPLPEQFQ